MSLGSLEAPSTLQDIAALIGRSENVSVWTFPRLLFFIAFVLNTDEHFLAKLSQVELPLIVRRKTKESNGKDEIEVEVQLKLVPRNGWGGRGLLG